MRVSPSAPFIIAAAISSRFKGESESRPTFRALSHFSLHFLGTEDSTIYNRIMTEQEPDITDLRRLFNWELMLGGLDTRQLF